MSEVSTADLTIISVVFRDTFFMQQNLELTSRLNPGFAGKWLVVDNSPPLAVHPPPGLDARMIEGARPPQKTGDRGSLHHALGLEKALAMTGTRFVLLLDHDLYVVRRNWIAELLEHVVREGIGIFGATWHPRWFYQYAGFPSVHFMLIDLAKVPKATLDLKPTSDSDWWGLTLRKKKAPWGGRWPDWLRDTLRAHRLRDTGWQVYRRYRRQASVKIGMLTPHYVPPDTRRRRAERTFLFFLPDTWRHYPRRADSYTQDSLLKTMLPEAYDDGWEDFFWRGEPFAVHLRRVGRRMRKANHSADEDLLKSFLARISAD